MFQSYEQIFARRADAYQKAMELFPAARDRELQLVVEAAGIKAGDIVCDAPAGGGYLRAYLPGGVQQYLAVETAADFTSHCRLGDGDRIIQSPLDQIELQDDCVDVCITLAGLHHMKDKSGFYREAARILKPGGRLVIADVESGTAAGRFLNQYVDQHNSMGHEGVFLDEHTADDISACGFRVCRDEVIDFPWSFETRANMGTYCKLLFGIDLAAAEEVSTAIEDILGYMPGPENTNMAWSLRVVAASRS